MKQVRATLIMLVLIFLITVSWANSDIPLSAIIEGYKQVRIKSVDVIYTYLSHSLPLREDKEYPYGKTRQRWVKQNDKEYYESEYWNLTSPDDKVKHNYRLERWVVTKGQIKKFSDDGKYQRGVISELKPGSDFTLASNLLERLYDVLSTYWSPDGTISHKLKLSELISQDSTQLIGQETINGSKTYILQCYTPVLTLYFKVWIDATRGFMPLKIICFDEECRLRREVNDIELRQVNDVWFPVRGVIKFYSYLPNEPKSICYIQVEELHINEEVEPGLFEMTWPPGTFVWDYIQGTRYIIPAED